MIILLLQWLFRLCQLWLLLSAIQRFPLAFKHHACLWTLSQCVVPSLPLPWVLALVSCTSSLLSRWLKLKRSLVPLDVVAIAVQIAMWLQYLTLVNMWWNMWSIEPFLVTYVHLVVLRPIFAALIAHAFLAAATFAWALASRRSRFFGVVFTWFSGVALFRIGGVSALSGLVRVAVAQGSNGICGFSWIRVIVLAVAGVLRAHLHLRASILARS